MVFLFDGIPLIAPELIASLFPRGYDYKSFPDHFCGTGEGLYEKIVPDYIFGNLAFLSIFGINISIKISPACWIHDKDYLFGNPSWEAFYEANDRLHSNMENIIHAKCRNEWLKAKALYRPVTYRNSVDLGGKGVFWTLKAAQNHTIPDDALGYVNKANVRLLKNQVLRRNLNE